MVRVNSLQFASNTETIDTLLFEARRLALVATSDYRVIRASSLPDLATTARKRIAMDAYTTLSNYLATSRISDLVEAFFICNADGIQIASASAKIPSSSLQDGELAMQRISSGSVSSVFTYTDSLDGTHPVIALALPFASAYLYMELSTSLLDPFFSMETTFLKNGIVLHDGTSRYLPEGFPLPPVWNATYEGSSPVKWQGHAYLHSLFTTQQCDFSLVSFLDYTLLANTKTNLEYTIFFIAMVLIFVSFVLGLLLTRQINRPVRQLITHIQKLQQHALVPDPAIEQGGTEFAAIGKTLNGMTVEINKLLLETEAMYKERQKQEIVLLQSQVNPHFLYNSLETIKSMAHIQKNSGIEKMTKNLVLLLKNLAKGTDDLIPIRDECTLVDAYITIQKISYADSFDFINNIPDEIMDTCLIRKFTLQPIVENAILHGIGTAETRNGLIILEGHLTDNEVVLEVTDNGVGMDEATSKSLLRTERKGMMTVMGMYNVNKRIQLNFGPAYGLSIHSELGKGTTVTIRLPRRIDVQRTDC
jgi:two-component system sensor histidine kinase YesM